MAISHRFLSLAQRDINKETFVETWPEAGLIVADSPADPAPSLRLEDGRMVELDGRASHRPLPEILQNRAAGRIEREKADVELDRIWAGLGLLDRGSN